MAVTVRANGLTISHKGSGGYEKNSTPDVCLTPPTPSPIPYSIVSFSAGIVRGTTTVFADGGNSIDHKSSAHTPCVGDAPGTLKGVGSGTILHESTWITYSPNVYVQKKNISRHSDKMFMNNKNCVSGTGGNIEPALINSLSKKALMCLIFCKAYNELKDKKGSPREFQKRADEIFDQNSSKILKRFPNMARAPTIVSYASRALKRSSAWLVGTAGKSLVSATARTFMIRAVGKAAFKKLLTAIGAASIPVAGWFWAALTVASVGADLYTAYDLWKTLRASHWYRVKPDFATMSGEDASEIFEMKFPGDRYRNGQQEIYDNAVKKGKHHTINLDSCDQCDKKRVKGLV